MKTVREFRMRELIERAARGQRRMELAGLSARVRETADERTARYYTTTGLLSPPLRYDGRRALYGERHVLELLAVKRLQAQGMTLEDARERMRGRPDADLLKLAGLEKRVFDEVMNVPVRGLDMERPTRRREARGRVQSWRLAPGVYVMVDLDQAESARVCRMLPKKISEWLAWPAAENSAASGGE